MKACRLLNVFVTVLMVLAYSGLPTGRASADVLLTVTTVSEGSDQTPGDGVCATSLGDCTLRAAIEEANALPGMDTINFNLPGAGVHSISITAATLPSITDSAILNGASQPNCSIPCIVLSGANLAGSNNGLVLKGDFITVKGFIITSWSLAGISISGQSNVVKRNMIGFWPGNPASLPNAYGIEIEGPGNKIGGAVAVARNVISGNTYNGIAISRSGGAAPGNIIRGNYIGTNETGTAALPNGQSGIIVYPNATDTVIGGTVAGTRNVISGNGWRGIDSGTAGIMIQGNFIGTNAAGNAAIPNGAGGIFIDGGNALIGGTVAAARNVIAYNTGYGIAFYGDTTRVGMLRNSIHGNSGLGIDVGFNGVTVNDILDVDTGPNDYQNFPVVASATSATRVLFIKMRSQVNQTYRLDFFSSPPGTCDALGYGEGKKWIGTTTVTTNGNGAWNGSVTTSLAFGVGAVITATATDSGGATSEFSLCRVAL